jgi:hypothetical protein
LKRFLLPEILISCIFTQKKDKKNITTQIQLPRLKRRAYQTLNTNKTRAGQRGSDVPTSSNTKQNKKQKKEAQHVAPLH